MARWEKRLAACQYARLGKSKLDRLVREGKIAAKKDGDGVNASVFIDLDTVDRWFEAMRPRPATLKKPDHKAAEQAA